MSFQTVLKKMKLSMYEEMSSPTGPMTKAEFWSRCALFAVIAIMKSCPIHTDAKPLIAAEAVLNYCSIEESKKWLEEVDSDLTATASRVKTALLQAPDQDDSLASLATVAILGGGQKCLALERIRRAVHDKNDDEDSTVNECNLDKKSKLTSNEEVEIDVTFSDQEDTAKVISEPPKETRIASDKVEIPVAED